MEYTHRDKRIYLRLGDRVTHLWHEEWGSGAVVEERTSVVPGGTCLVRLLWQDGQVRTFNNDLDHEQCCFFFGVRRVDAIDFDARPPVRGAAARPPRIAEPPPPPPAPGELLGLPPRGSRGERSAPASAPEGPAGAAKRPRRRARAIEVQIVSPSRPAARKGRAPASKRLVVDVTPARPRGSHVIEGPKAEGARARAAKPRPRKRR